MKYFSTFISGLHDIIKEILERKVKDIKILELFDGAVIYSTNYNIEDYNLLCFNNTFELLDYKKSNSNKPIEEIISYIIKNKKKYVSIKNIKKNIRTFRIITSIENQLVAIDNNSKKNIEKFIIESTNLLLNRSLPDIEYWLLYRNEGYSYFLKRITRHRAYDKILNKGELHPELAYMLNWISEPKDDEVFLDPFCGYGSIPIQRMNIAKAKALYAFDIDSEMIRYLKNKVSKNDREKNNFICKVSEIGNISNLIENNTVDKIVTDPPWGNYVYEDIDQLYNIILKESYKVLKNEGILVVLTSKKDELRKIVEEKKMFKIIEEYSILVSGKKAGIFKLTKLN